jgi:hypothetical protein
LPQACSANHVEGHHKTKLIHKFEARCEGARALQAHVLRDPKSVITAARKPTAKVVIMKSLTCSKQSTSQVPRGEFAHFAWLCADFCCFSGENPNVTEYNICRAINSLTRSSHALKYEKKLIFSRVGYAINQMCDLFSQICHINPQWIKFSCSC